MKKLLGFTFKQKLKFDRYLNKKYLIVNSGIALLRNIRHYRYNIFLQIFHKTTF